MSRQPKNPAPTHEQAKKAATQGDLLEKMQKENCILCHKPQFINAAVQAGKRNEQGGLEPVPDVSFPFPFCLYHFGLAQTGLLHAIVDEAANKVELTGPWDAIPLIERVFDAKMMYYESQQKELRIENHHLRNLDRCSTCDGTVKHETSEQGCDGCTHLRTCIPMTLRKHHKTEGAHG